MVATRQAGGKGRPCRLEYWRTVCEDGYRFINFACLEHGTTWREFVGGTTKPWCIRKALARLPAVPSVPPEEARACLEEDVDALFDDTDDV